MAQKTKYKAQSAKHYAQLYGGVLVRRRGPDRRRKRDLYTPVFLLPGNSGVWSQGI